VAVSCVQHRILKQAKKEPLKKQFKKKTYLTKHTWIYQRNTPTKVREVLHFAAYLLR